jgi:hypothetical protein
MSAPAETAYLRLSFRHRCAGTALRPFHRLGTRKHFLRCEIGVSQRASGIATGRSQSPPA